jgi:hypothetical protein
MDAVTVAWGGAGDRHRTGERRHLRSRRLLRRTRREAHPRRRRHRVRRPCRARRARALRAAGAGPLVVRCGAVGRALGGDRGGRDLPALRRARDRTDEHPVAAHRRALGHRADDLGPGRRGAAAVVGLPRPRRSARRHRARRLRAREGCRATPPARARLRDPLRHPHRLLLHPRRPGTGRLGAVPDRREPRRRRGDPARRARGAARAGPPEWGARVPRPARGVGSHRRLRDRGCRRQRAHPHRAADGRPHGDERARRALPGRHDRPRRARAAGTHRARAVDRADPRARRRRGAGDSGMRSRFVCRAAPGTHPAVVPRADPAR